MAYPTGYAACQTHTANATEDILIKENDKFSLGEKYDKGGKPCTSEIRGREERK